MFRRILVTLDGTRSSASVVPDAAEVAKRLGCRVDLLLVENEKDARLPHPEHHHYRPAGDDKSEAPDTEPCPPQEVRRANKRYVARHAEEFEALGVETSGHVRKGHPVEEILRAALDLRCDMIAMATRHRGRFARPEKGSVAEEILWRSRLPVLLIAEG